MNSRKLLVVVVGVVSAVPGLALAAGGELCANATSVNTVPFSDIGNTCEAQNDYGEVCSGGQGGRDVVYTFMPAADDCINISLCNTPEPTDFRMYVYALDAGGCPTPASGDTNLDISCTDNDCGVLPRILGLQVQAGVRYWVVVDGNGAACGGYQIDIVRCPSGQCTTHAQCDDGEFCNGQERCGEDFRCHPAAGSPCNDANPCTSDSCVESLESCIHAPIPGCCRDGRDCQDESVCNGIERCENSVCQSGPSVSCDDGDPCTRDHCDDDAGICDHLEIPGCCQTAADCNDSNPCTNDDCQNHECVRAPSPPGTTCGDPRTTSCSLPDRCDGEGFCRPLHRPDGTDCDDQNECTGGDRCISGRCLGLLDPTCETCKPGPVNDPLQSISFQALLTGSDDLPVRGPVELLFYIYDAVGNLLATVPPRNNVVAIDGIVNALIPADSTWFGDGLARFVGVSVDGGPELLPRIPLSSSPQAFRVDCLEKGDLAEILELGGDGRGGVFRLRRPHTPNTAGGINAAYSAQMDGATGNFDTIGDVHAGVGDSGFPSAEMGAMSSMNDNIQNAFCLCGGASYKSDECNTMVAINACESDNLFPSGGGGEIKLMHGESTKTIELDAYDGGNDGTAEFSMWNPDGDVETFELVATEAGGDGSQITMRQANGQNGIVLDAETGAEGAFVAIRRSDGLGGAEIDSESESGARIRLYQNDYDPDVNDLEDDIGVLIDGDADAGDGGYGRIRLRNADGDSRIYLDGDFEGSGKGRIRTDILRIEGGSDLSESFNIHGEEIRPGFLVSIDPNRPGELLVSGSAYDHRLAGVISGAGGVETGLLMGQPGTIADGQYPVAMTGRVYCWADASEGAIQPGDLLTTSSTPGHAMRVSDPSQSHGAVIGKAMTGLSQGRGLVLVLIRPQ